MKKIKKVLRLLVLIGFIILAGVGVGLSGGVPLPRVGNKRDPAKEKIELIESQNEKAITKQNLRK